MILPYQVLQTFKTLKRRARTAQTLLPWVLAKGQTASLWVMRPYLSAWKAGELQVHAFTQASTHQLATHIVLHLTRSKVVFSRMSTIFSNLVFAVKKKSSSTQSTYLVVTWDTARFLPANQPCIDKGGSMLMNWDVSSSQCMILHRDIHVFTFPNGMM